LHVQDRRGGTGVLTWVRVTAISVGRIGGGPDASAGAGSLILDLLMAASPTGAGPEYRAVRLAVQDLAIPQLQGEPTPVRIFQRFVATVLKATGAAAYPSREACLTLQGLPAAPDVATYEADLLARLTAGS